MPQINRIDEGCASACVAAALIRDIELFDKPLTLRAGDIPALMSDGVYTCLPWKEAISFCRKARDSYLELGKTNMAELMQDKIDFALNASSPSTPEPLS